MTCTILHEIINSLRLSYKCNQMGLNTRFAVWQQLRGRLGPYIQFISLVHYPYMFMHIPYRHMKWTISDPYMNVYDLCIIHTVHAWSVHAHTNGMNISCTFMHDSHMNVEYITIKDHPVHLLAWWTDNEFKTLCWIYGCREDLSW